METERSVERGELPLSTVLEIAFDGIVRKLLLGPAFRAGSIGDAGCFLPQMNVCALHTALLSAS